MVTEKEKQYWRGSGRGSYLGTILRVCCIVSALFFLCFCSFLRPPRTTTFIQYVLKPGDNLYALSKRFDVAVDDIEDSNDLVDVRRLKVGQVVHIPYNGQSLGKKGKAIGGATKKWNPKDVKRINLGEARRDVGRLAWPVKRNGKLTSKFGRRWLTFHEGIDIAAPTGTPIYAAHEGAVVYSGRGLKGYGNLIVVRGARLLSVYAHNHRNRVRRGERVRKGEHIADVGASGKATGPHLHFELRIRDKQNKNAAVDPLVFYP